MSVTQSVKDLNRLRQIVDVFFEKEFGYIIQQVKLRSYLVFHKRLQRRKFEKTITSEPERLREAMEELGGAFLKLGQFLSLRSDFIPKEYAEEFKKLQDDVPPFTYQEVQSLIQQEFKKQIHGLFLKFEKTPIAAASVGQVHKAWLKNGTKVAVKVQRPHMEDKYKTDIDLLYHLSDLLKKHYPGLGDFNLQEIIEEFEGYTKKELNYQLEARNIKLFNRNFHKDKNIKIPSIYDDFTTTKILTMEYVSGIKLSQWLKENKNKKKRRQIAIKLTDTILKQIFEYHLFHADPHPGNILVLEDDRVALLDFGIIGKISSDGQENYENLFISLAKPDREMLAQSMIDMGFVEDEVNLEKFKEDLSEHLGAYYDLAMDQMDISALLSDIIQLGREYHIRFPVNFLLLAKTAATIEGTNRQLAPEFQYMNRWKIQCKKLIRKRTGPIYMMNSLKQNSIFFRNFLLHMPKNAKKLFFGQKQMTVHVDTKDINKFTLRVDTALNRISYGLIMSAFVIASALLIRSSAPVFLGLPLISVIFLILAILSGLILLRSITKEKGGKEI